MESTEKEESREKNPPLPANYVSIVQLQERWLQQQKQENGKQKEKRRLKQPQQEEKLHIASRNRGLEKEKQKPRGNQELGCRRNGPRRVEDHQKVYGRRRVEDHQKVYVPKRVISGNPPRNGGIEKGFMSEEVDLGAPAYCEAETSGAMEEKNVSGRRKKKNWKKSVVGVGESLNEEDENRRNVGAFTCRTGGMRGRKGEGEFGRGGHVDEGDKGNGNACMVVVVPENERKEETSLGMGGIHGVNGGSKEHDWGNSDDWRLGGNLRVCKIEELLENAWGEDVPVAVNADDKGVAEASGSGHTVEMLPENEVEKDCSVSEQRKKGKKTCRKKDQGIFGDGYWRNFSDWRKGRFSNISEIDSRRENNKVEELVSVGENDRQSDQRGWTSRAIQAYGDQKLASSNLSPKIRRNLRGLSLDGNKEGNVTSRKWQHGYEKSRDHSLVWVKKGKNSDTNDAEI